MGRPGWIDYLAGVEGKNSLILPGAQIYSKPGEEGTAGHRSMPGRGPHTHQSRQHLEECLFRDAKERCGQQPGRVRSLGVWPSHRTVPTWAPGGALAGTLETGFKSWLCLTRRPRGDFRFPVCTVPASQSFCRQD